MLSYEKIKISFHRHFKSLKYFSNSHSGAFAESFRENCSRSREIKHVSNQWWGGGEGGNHLPLLFCRRVYTSPVLWSHYRNYGEHKGLAVPNSELSKLSP